MLRFHVILIAVSSLVLSNRCLEANTISYSFGSTLAAGETAGTGGGAGAANWNAFTSGGTLGTTKDNTGAATGATSTLTANGFGFANGGGSNDAHLFTGWFDQSDTASSNLLVSNVPYAKYDVYVYMHNDRDANPNDRSGEFTIDGANRFARGPSANSTYDPGQSGTYHLSTDSTQTSIGSTSAGDYVLFSGLSDASLTVTFSVALADNTVERNKFVGLQIVQTPEPSSIILCGLGALGLFAVARRRTRKS